MNLSIKQSEITELTDQLQKFSSLVELFKEGRADQGLFASELARFESIDWQQENMFNQMLGYHALASAFGALKCKNLDYTEAYYDNAYVNKEVSYYHNVQYIVTRVAKEDWAALYNTAFKASCRAFLCLANAYDHLGRFCEAQQYYKLAALDKRNQKDVEVNQGYSYGNMHAFWESEEPWIVRKAQQIMRRYPKDFDKATPGLRETVCSWKTPSFDAPRADFTAIADGDYEYWVNTNYLRINRYCDVEPLSELSIADNVKLHQIKDTKEMQNIFASSFDEIKRTFVDTRKITYTAIKDEIRIDLLKMTYKSFYSLLDKIAIFLKAYLSIPIEVHRVDFSTIWTDKKGLIRPEFLAHPQNLSLLALYNVKLDVYGSKSVGYVVDEQTKDLQRIRNFLEHKIVSIRDGAMEYDEYQLKISKRELALNTIRLAQLVRCSIIYLCNFVLHAEYDKKINNPLSMQ